MLAMLPGIKMDLLIAEKVMGYQYIDDPDTMWYALFEWEKLDHTVVFVSKRFGVKIASKNGHGPFHPSSEISATWSVVRKSSSFLLENPQTYEPDEWYCEISFKGSYRSYASANTPELAICRASLLAVTKGNK